MGHELAKEILKSCDIRGIYGSELKAVDAYYIGKSFGTIIKRYGAQSCAVGYDVRLSSPELSRKLIYGLLECGINITDIGMNPSPAVYYAVNELGFDSGVVITASHNPSEYNGIKFVLKDRLFHGDMIDELGRLSESGDFSSGQTGALRKTDITHDYLKFLLSFVDSEPETKLKVVWDPGNGAVSDILKQLVRFLPGEHSIIFGEPDGRFPNHHADPSLPENMEHLQEEVRKKKADCGIAFDGDGDRIGVVDEAGRILQGDELLVIYSRDFLKKNPGEIVMSEVKASEFLYEDIKRQGGVPIMWKVGHTHQKEKMRREKIQLAGETSGHMFFAENHFCDDGLFSAVKLLNILGESSISLYDIKNSFPRLFDSGEIRLKLDFEQRLKLVNDIVFRLKEDNREFFDLDGVRVSCNKGFWMLRGSNTQPHITIRCEAATERGLEECFSEMRSYVEAAGINFNAARLR